MDAVRLGEVRIRTQLGPRLVIGTRRAAWRAVLPGLLRRGLAFGVPGVLLFLFYIPWWTGPCGPEPDPSSEMAIHLGFEQGWDFGKDIVWPFGPFGFLYSKTFYPSDYWVTLLGSTLFALAFFLGLCVWSRRLTDNLVGRSLAIVAGVVLGALTLDTTFFLLIFLALALHMDRIEAEPGLGALLAVALGLSALVKFTFFMLSGFVTIAVGLDGFTRRRRLPAFSYLYPLSVLAFWILARQPLLSIIPFVAHRMTISLSYTQAMAINGAWKEVGAFCAGALVVFGFASYIEMRRHSTSGFLPIAAMAGFLFVVFKEGFVRQDEHAIIASSVLVFVALDLMRVRLLKELPSMTRLFCAAPSLLCLCLLWWSMRLHTEEGLYRYCAWLGGTFDDRAAAFGRFVTDPHRMDREFVEYLARIRSENPMPALGPETVDSYPHGQTILLANRLRYSPRPVIQSYMTYDKTLSRLNAAHLGGERKADNIFFHVWPIDQRYPSLDDGLSWPEILDRYAVVEESDQMLWLKRRSQPLGLKFVQVQSQVVGFNEDSQVPAPDGGPIWARIDLKLSMLGRAASFLFKTPWVYMTVNTSDGSTYRYTLVPALSRAGFLLSPLVLDHHGFASLMNQSATRNQTDLGLVSFRLSTLGSPGLFYQARPMVTYYRIVIPSERTNAAGGASARGMEGRAP